MLCPRCNGQTLRRIPSIPGVNREALEAAGKYPYVSHKWSDGDLGGGCRTTAEGHPIVESQAHERDIIARTGLIRT